VIDLVIAPELDDARLADGGPTSLPEDPAHGKIGEGLWDLTGQKWEETALTCLAGGVWDRASMRVHPRAGRTALVHGLLHGVGWVPKHEVFHPPTGHVLDRDKPSLHDWRGIDGRKPADVVTLRGAR
jgi:hypothetical protein